MIQELVEYGKRVTKGKCKAFCEEAYSVVLAIDSEGTFKGLTSKEGSIETARVTEHEEKNKKKIGMLSGKKGHARFLLDKGAEVLGVGKDVEKKHKAFMAVLERYREVSAMKPVFTFYNNKNELSKAVDAFAKLKTQDRNGNITFMVGTQLLLQNEEVRNAIINLYERDEQRLKDGRVCSVCGKADSPVLDEPHGTVLMPKGQRAGSALVSFNIPVFESYGFSGNLNSSICRDCARNYIEGLKSLLDGHYEGEDDKRYYKYDHRVNISDNTVALFWTQKETEFNPLILDNPPESVEVRNLFGSIWSGESKVESIVDSEMFYSCTLSSAAARIAVRDWTAISLKAYKKNIADWFKDIEILDGERLVYSPLRLLIKATQRDPRAGEKKKGDINSKARIGSILWKAAIKGHSYIIPIEVLQYVLTRIWKNDKLSIERAALIKLIINRNTNKNMKSTLDKANTSVAYLCGRLFAVIESMQWKAVGSINSGVKERFFSAAASQPAYIFGTLLTKNVPIYQHKISGYLAKELNEITGAISECGSFPQRFTPIEQGEFALGYYFQKTHKPNNEEKSINL